MAVILYKEKVIQRKLVDKSQIQVITTFQIANLLKVIKIRFVLKIQSMKIITNDQKGSAILFKGKGQCCMNRLCGTYCKSQSGGHFSSTEVSEKQKNYMNYSTIFFLCLIKQNIWCLKQKDSKQC